MIAFRMCDNVKSLAVRPCLMNLVERFLYEALDGVYLTAKNWSKYYLQAAA